MWHRELLRALEALERIAKVLEELLAELRARSKEAAAHGTQEGRD